MSPGWALALALAARLAAAPDASGAPAASAALAPARAAFTQGDYGAAEALAVAAARPPQAGAALYLAGLARFRLGRAAEALEALDAAGAAADPPPPGPWQFNRGACLYELGRLAEAEAAYLDAAARAPELAAVALADAGFAALDAGAPDRARDLAGRARALAQGAALDVVADLEAHLAAPAAGAAEAPAAEPPAVAAHRAGIAAYDAGRWAEARDDFRRALTLDPAQGRSAVMGAAAALRLGERETARRELRQATAAGLPPGDAAVAAAYLDAAAPGLAPRAAGWGFAARLGTGFDSNVTQSELPRASAATGRVDSAFATAGLELAVRGRLGTSASAELAYAADQLAYLESDAEDYSVQQHVLAAAVDVQVADRVRLGASVAGQLAFTGLSAFRGLQGAVLAGASAACEESDRTTTRAELTWTAKRGLIDEFDYLTGDRLDAALAQELRLLPFRLELSYRFRREGIGTVVENPQLADVPPCGMMVPCEQRYVIPLAYASHALTLAATVPLLRWLDAGVAGGVERRTYAEDSYLQLLSGGQVVAELDRRRRQDDRLLASAHASARPVPWLALSLRYDLLLNSSNVNASAGGTQGCNQPDGPCHALDYDELNYAKHTVLLEAIVAW